MGFPQLCRRGYSPAARKVASSRGGCDQGRFGAVVRWVAACPLDSLTEGKVSRVELNGVGLCLLRLGSVVHAVEDRCPHRGARLSGGVVYDGCKVACPDHGWSIDLSTGKVEPPECGQAQLMRLKVRDGWVFVDSVRG
jgi:nitrite reductase/ring-hydroxylating ferredoxin subunit